MKINKINLLCIGKGKTPYQVAEEIKVDPRRFSKIACGHEKTCWLRKKIAEFFGISPHELWPDYEEPEPKENARNRQQLQAAAFGERKRAGRTHK